jgi:hypothetical protein
MAARRVDQVGLQRSAPRNAGAWHCAAVYADLGLLVELGASMGAHRRMVCHGEQLRISLLHTTLVSMRWCQAIHYVCALDIT